MELLDQKVRVAPTAALVLLQARELFNEGITKDYLSYIDFTPVLNMSDQLNSMPGDFARIVCYRKKYIRYLVDAYLPESEPVQVVILGAGLDPLALHLLEAHKGDICNVFEVDTSHLAEKEIIYKKLLPDAANLHLVHCDITDPQLLLESLLLAGYDKDIQTIVIFEGIVHYITQEKFYDIMRRFRTRNRTNLVLMDYALPFEDVPDSVLPGYRRMLQTLEASLKCRVYLHSRLNMFGLIDRLGGDVSTIDSVQDIEFKLNGRNERYYEPGDGYMEMISYYL